MVPSREQTETSPQMSNPVVRAEGVGKSFGKRLVLDGVDFSIGSGEKVCIVGPSGSGKTTLLRCFNLLVEPTLGSMWFRGELVGEWPARGRLPVHPREHRRRFGMVFQHFELFPHLTALGNVTLGPRHVLRENPSVARDRAMELLQRVGLEKHAADRPATLSGGQKQRVAIARALAMRPEVLLFDEPTSALDAEMVDEVLQLIRSLADTGITMVIVTHELRFARDLADRIVVMEAGRIVEEGPTEVLFERPAQRRTREILRSSS